MVGLNDIFPFKLVKRANIDFRIGKPFGPLKATGSGRERRAQLDEMGHDIMRSIAELLPQEKRGRYSDDPVIREAAKEFEAYPWDEKLEGEVVGEVH